MTNEETPKPWAKHVACESCVTLRKRIHSLTCKLDRRSDDYVRRELNVAKNTAASIAKRAQNLHGALVHMRKHNKELILENAKLKTRLKELGESDGN